MKTLKEFKVNKVDMQDIYGGKGGNGPTVSWTYHYSSDGPVTNQDLIIIAQGGTVPGISSYAVPNFDQGAQ